MTSPTIPTRPEDFTPEERALVLRIANAIFANRAGAMMMDDDAFDDLETEDKIMYLADGYQAVRVAAQHYTETAAERDRLLSANKAMREALEKLCTTASILLQNAEGCATIHHQVDFGMHGVPGWLSDSEKNITAARAALKETP